jgi:Ca-activated chloride channel family protein
VRYRYTRFTGDLLDDLSIEELVSQLSNTLLSSGFYDPYGLGRDDSLQSLHDAILEALLNGGLLPDDVVERLLQEMASDEGRSALDELVERLVERLQEQGYVTVNPESGTVAPGEGPGQAQGSVRFELTDKSLDFLGYRALRDLLGSLGRSSFGRHDTRDVHTGVEASGAPKPYEFGDTMNLDASATILSAVRRHADEHGTLASIAGRGLTIEHGDLMVSQGEYQSSCATVLLLDCSHSMILYGEDRFTPAKRVALALAALIERQYPGDALSLVLFHDSAEEVPLRQLARVRVGPYYTNTREGLRLSRRILERQSKDMRQIVMITDGKPSAMTQPDGRIYKSAFGLDPLIVSETIKEVAACRKAGILINTFMLARDHDLVAFVRKVAEICHGKAYFTSPMTLGRYVLMDYLNRKTRTVH